jgi:hypothetical protein
MKIQTLVSPVVFAGALIVTCAAHGKTISISGHSPTNVKKGCGGGGTYFAPSSGGVYGCLNGDGSGIVCGGTGDNYSKTCDTWGKAPAGETPRTKLPSREEIKDHTDMPQ